MCLLRTRTFNGILHVVSAQFQICTLQIHRPALPYDVEAPEVGDDVVVVMVVVIVVLELAPASSTEVETGDSAELLPVRKVGSAGKR